MAASVDSDATPRERPATARSQSRFFAPEEQQEEAMDVEAGISLVILAFVVLGGVYDVELSAEGRALHSRGYR